MLKEALDAENPIDLHSPPESSRVLHSPLESSKVAKVLHSLLETCGALWRTYEVIFLSQHPGEEAGSPAQLIRMSSLFSFWRKSLQKPLTELRLARSRSMWQTFRLRLCSLISVTALRAFSGSRQATMIRAPLVAKATAVSFPTPEFPP